MMVQKFVLGITASAVLALGGTTLAFADSTGNTGQPGQTCQLLPAGSQPGNSVNAPGSAFNPNGTAGTHYAGNAPQNSNNPNSVSQYDVACFQQSQH